MHLDIVSEKGTQFSWGGDCKTYRILCVLTAILVQYKPHVGCETYLPRATIEKDALILHDLYGTGHRLDHKINDCNLRLPITVMSPKYVSVLPYQLCHYPQNALCSSGVET